MECALERLLPHPPTPLRKGDRTRARLIAATIQVLGSLGYKNASVLEITKAAKVSNATFYLYFKSKAEVMDAAVFQVAEEISNQIYEDEKDIADVVRRCAYAVRHFMAAVLADPSWAKAMLETYAALPEQQAWAHVRKFMLRTLHDGIAQGVFFIEGSALQIECVISVIMMAVRMQLEGSAGPDAIRDCIVLVLRMVGVSREDADAAARPVSIGQVQ